MELVKILLQFQNEIQKAHEYISFQQNIGLPPNKSSIHFNISEVEISLPVFIENVKKNISVEELSKLKEGYEKIVIPYNLDKEIPITSKEGAKDFEGNVFHVQILNEKCVPENVVKEIISRIIIKYKPIVK